MNFYSTHYSCFIVLEVLLFWMDELFVPLMLYRNMALQKFLPSGDAPTMSMKRLTVTSKVREKVQLDVAEQNHDVEVDLREVYFLIMHFLSSGPCQRTCVQLWNELLEHQLLPRRYHAWYSRSGMPSGDEDDSGLSFPLSYNQLVERYL